MRSNPVGSLPCRADNYHCPDRIVLTHVFCCCGDRSPCSRVLADLTRCRYPYRVSLSNIVNITSQPRHAVVSMATLSCNDPPGACEHCKMPAKHRTLLPALYLEGQEQAGSQSSQQCRSAGGKKRKTSACQHCRQKKRKVCTTLPMNLRF